MGDAAGQEKDVTAGETKRVDGGQLIFVSGYW
jgi:hypothetical protein